MEPGKEITAYAALLLFSVLLDDTKKIRSNEWMDGKERDCKVYLLSLIL